MSLSELGDPELFHDGLLYLIIHAVLISHDRDCLKGGSGMLEIRIGYGDMVSKQMGIPMSASDFEVAKRSWMRKLMEAAGDGPGFTGSAAVRDDYRNGLRYETEEPISWIRGGCAYKERERIFFSP